MTRSNPWMELATEPDQPNLVAAAMLNLPVHSVEESHYLDVGLAEVGALLHFGFHYYSIEEVDKNYSVLADFDSDSMAVVYFVLLVGFVEAVVEEEPDSDCNPSLVVRSVVADYCNY